jgi:hypothetical protein
MAVMNAKEVLQLLELSEMPGVQLEVFEAMVGKRWMDCWLCWLLLLVVVVTVVQSWAPLGQYLSAQLGFCLIVFHWLKAWYAWHMKGRHLSFICPSLKKEFVRRMRAAGDFGWKAGQSESYALELVLLGGKLRGVAWFGHKFHNRGPKMTNLRATHLAL